MQIAQLTREANRRHDPSHDRPWCDEEMIDFYGKFMTISQKKIIVVFRCPKVCILRLQIRRMHRQRNRIFQCQNGRG